jgi:hypothetical protein
MKYGCIAVRNSIVITAIVALLGCVESSGPNGPTTTVIRFQGTVRSAAGQAPINQAEIILQWSAGAYGTGTHWAYTDVDGKYNLEKDFGGVPFGCDFGITVQAMGYRPQFVQPEQIRCVPEVQTFDFALEPGQ